MQFTDSDAQDLAQLLRVRDSFELTPTLQAYLDELLGRRKLARERSAGMELVRLACLRLDDEAQRERERAEQAARDAEQAALAAEHEAEQRERVAGELGCSVDEVEARVAALPPEPPVYLVPDPNGGGWRQTTTAPEPLLPDEDEDAYRERIAREDAERAEARRRERLAPVHHPEPPEAA